MQYFHLHKGRLLFENFFFFCGFFFGRQGDPAPSDVGEVGQGGRRGGLGRDAVAIDACTTQWVRTQFFLNLPAERQSQ